MAETDKNKNENEKEKAEKAEKGPSAAAIAKALDGVEFRTNKALPVLDDSTGKPVLEGGKPKLRYVPDLRAMTAGDVLNAYYAEGVLVIVSKDGSKHRVTK